MSQSDAGAVIAGPWLGSYDNEALVGALTRALIDVDSGRFVAVDVALTEKDGSTKRLLARTGCRLRGGQKR